VIASRNLYGAGTDRRTPDSLGGRENDMLASAAAGKAALVPALQVKQTRMRLTITLILFSLTVFSAAAPADANRRVIVGVHQNPPLIFVDSDGLTKGIAVDFLAAIAHEENWTVQYLPGSWGQCTRRLKTGIVDLLPAVAVTREMEDRFTFGKETIVTDRGQLYVRSDSPFTDILDLHGKDIAVVKKDIYYQSFKSILVKFEIRPRYIEVKNYAAVLSLVSQGKVTGGIVPRFLGAYYEKRFPVNKSPISFGPNELRFAVAGEGNIDVLATLDRHLARLKSTPDSIFHQSLDRWTQGVRKVTLPSWIKPLWVLTGTVAIMGLIIGGIVFLRRQVKLRTETLKKTIIEKEKFESELAVARQIQLQLLPDNTLTVPRRKEFDLFASLEPAREVGGDFYDYFFIDRNALCLVIGDVSGKGVPAALFMAMTKTMLKSAARLLFEPEFILADVNREIARNNPSLTFVTVFLGVLDLSTGRLTYASAGHNPPLFIGRQGNSVLLGDAPCPAIGLDDSFQYTQATIHLRHQEGLLLYTDGVTEAQNDKNVLFSQEALMTTISLTPGLTPRERIAAVLSRVREFTGKRPLEDDVTLLALTYFSPNWIGDTLKTIVLKNDIREMSRIADTIAQVADSVSCPPVVTHDATLAMEEIFSNIVFYGFGDEMDHNITFHIVAEDDALVLTLQDEGIPFNPLNVQVGPRDRPLEERDKGGMGIILAKKLMDRMEYRREQGKNILQMVKHYR
jgi:sigma-B regulation protein RsbU (phosphoserine phosphatase)